MGSRRCASFVAPTVLIEIVVAACSGDEPVSSDGPKASPGEPIKIGVVAELSGPLAPYGASIADSALIAVAEINAAGGIAGRDVVAVVEDIESDATVATERATKLVEEYRADVVAGPAGSDANDAAFQAVVQAGGTLQLYPTIYEGLKSDPLFFSFGAVPAQQIRPLIDLLHNEFGSFAMLFSADYVWPQRSFEIARPIIEEKVGVVVSELFLPIVTEDFSELVAEVRDKQPDYILSLYPGAWVAALQALDEEGLLEGLGIGTHSSRIRTSRPLARSPTATMRRCRSLPSRRGLPSVGSSRTSRPPVMVPLRTGRPRSAPTSRSTCTSRPSRRPARPSQTPLQKRWSV